MTGVSGSARNAAGLVMVQAPRSAAAEAYRTLSTNIQFSSLDTPIRTLLVTSVGPNEGKSLVLANLAEAEPQAIALAVAGVLEPSIVPPHRLASPLPGPRPPVPVTRALAAL